MVLVRGFYNGPPKNQVRLDTAIFRRVDACMTDGIEVDISSRDIAKMARTGGYELPKDIHLDNDSELDQYCSSILIHLHPNHGSVKKEQWGGSLRYKFIPDIPKLVKT